MATNDAAVLAVSRLARVFEKELAEVGMTLPQLRVLAFLSEGDWAASKLADWLAVSRPSVTSLVDGLVERRWVERRESPEDRRSVLHQLTATGRAHLDQTTASLASRLDALLDHLDDEERARAEDGLALLNDAVRRHYESVVAS